MKCFKVPYFEWYHSLSLFFFFLICYLSHLLPPSGDISECIEKKKASGYKRVLFFSSFFQQIFTARNMAGKVRSTGKIKKKRESCAGETRCRKQNMHWNSLGNFLPQTSIDIFMNVMFKIKSITTLSRTSVEGTSYLLRWFSCVTIYFVARLPVLWPPDAKSQLTGEDPDAGKD